VSWVLRGYDAETEALVVDLDLEELVREWLRERLRLPPDDPMIASFPLLAEDAARLARSFGVALEATGTDFFLEHYR
jgi:hypothetical protein